MDNLNDHFVDDNLEDEAGSDRLSLASIILLLLMVVALISTLMWPVLWQALHRLNAPPTPIPIFMQEI